MSSSSDGIRAGRAYVELGTDLSDLLGALDRAQHAVQNFGNMSRQWLDLSMTVAPSVKTFAEFDDQMRMTQAVSNATGVQFSALTNTAKELGRTTSWTAAQVAEGMASLGRAGFSSVEIEKSISSVMDLARACGLDVGSATDIASNALRSFGLEASEMGCVCDVLTATANGSAQTLEDLGEAFKYVAPIAAATGLTIEDTAKIVGALANFGVKGSQAGTVFKNIQTRMATDKNARAVYAGLGIDLTDSGGNLRKVNDVISELGEKIKNFPSGERLKIIEAVFGSYGLTGISLTTANFQALNEAIDDADGTARKTAEQMDQGIGGAIRLTESAVEGLKIAAGEALAQIGKTIFFNKIDVAQ